MFILNHKSVDGVMISKEILTEEFVCDLIKCKGACCTMKSDYGAPLRQEEIALMEQTLQVVSDYLPKEHLEIIKKSNFWEIKGGELVTRSFEKKACVFVYYEGEIAKCAIEKAFFEGKVTFRKPISCHLFPIRVSNFGGDILRYEKISECKPATLQGKKLHVKVVDFCKDALIRLYGLSWFIALKDGKKEG